MSESVCVCVCVCDEEPAMFGSNGREGLRAAERERASIDQRARERRARLSLLSFYFFFLCFTRSSTYALDGIFPRRLA